MKKMTLPKQVVILGTLYDIEYMKQNEIKKVCDNDNDGNTILGLCNYLEKVIYIDENVTKTYELFSRILRHEILHAYTYESGNSVQIDWAVDEGCIDYYAIQMPKIFKTMLELGIEK